MSKKTVILGKVTNPLAFLRFHFELYHQRYAKGLINRFLQNRKQKKIANKKTWENLILQGFFTVYV